MRTFIVGFITLFFAACTLASAPSSQSAQEAFETYVAALNEGDVAKAAAYYDTRDGFHWVEQGGIRYETGADAAEALKALQSGGGKSKMTLDNMRVAEMTPTSALLSTHFDFTMLAADGTPQFGFDGWMTVGMVKRKDGWKIAGGQTGPGK